MNKARVAILQIEFTPGHYSDLNFTDHILSASPVVQLTSSVKIPRLINRADKKHNKRSKDLFITNAAIKQDVVLDRSKIDETIACFRQSGKTVSTFITATYDAVKSYHKLKSYIAYLLSELTGVPVFDNDVSVKWFMDKENRTEKNVIYISYRVYNKIKAYASFWTWSNFFDYSRALVHRERIPDRRVVTPATRIARVISDTYDVVRYYRFGQLSDSSALFDKNETNTVDPELKCVFIINGIVSGKNNKMIFVERYATQETALARVVDLLKAPTVLYVNSRVELLST